MFGDSDEICLQHILKDHSLRIEERAIDSDRMQHHINEAVAITVKHGNDCVLQLVVERGGIFRWITAAAGEPDVLSHAPPCCSLNTPFNPSSIITLKLGTPFSAAFIPLVPDASSGGWGVFSHTSTPEVIVLPSSMS